MAAKNASPDDEAQVADVRTPVHDSAGSCDDDPHDKVDGPDDKPPKAPKFNFEATLKPYLRITNQPTE
jgi:hypothetical protein